MSNTPRTEKLMDEWDYSPPMRNLLALTLDLEEELSKANERIKQLTDADKPVNPRHEPPRQL